MRGWGEPWVGQWGTGDDGNKPTEQDRRTDPTSRSIRVLFCVCIVGLGVLIGANAAVGVASASSQSIDSCTTINSSGTYELNTTVNASDTSACIEINASDVILDGQGNAIEGYSDNTFDTNGFPEQIRGSTAVRIAGTDAAPLRNVTIRDVELADGNRGINATHAPNIEVVDVTVTNADLQAIGVRETSEGNVTIRNVTTENSPQYPDDNFDMEPALYVGPESGAPDRIDITNLHVTGTEYTKKSSFSNPTVELVTDAGAITISDSNITAVPRSGLEADANDRDGFGQGDVIISNVSITDFDRIKIDGSGLFARAEADLEISNASLAGGGTSANTSDWAINAESEGGSFVLNDSAVRNISSDKAVEIDAEEDGVIRNLTIHNNTYREGLDAGATDRLDVDNVVITRTGDRWAGILNGEPVDIDGLTVNGTDQGGLRMSSFDGTTDLTNASISNVSGGASTYKGLEVNAHSGTYQNITVTDVGADGVLFVEAGDSFSDPALSLSNATIENVSGHGIDIEGDQVKISDTSVLDSNRTGIKHDSDVSDHIDISLRNVSVRDSGDNGIYFAEDIFDDGDDIGLTDVTVTNASGNGLELKRVPAILTDLDLRSAVLDGTARSVVINNVSSADRPTPPSDRDDVGAYLQANNTTSTGYLNLTVQYEDGDIPAGLDESTLSLWRHGGSWSEIGGTVDAGANTVSANITSFSVFAPLGGTSSTTINSCTRINESGSYELSADVTDGTTDTCIEIHASDVVLDGSGHTIDGADADTGSEAVAIDGSDVGSINNITVQNIILREWGIGYNATDATDITLQDATVENTSNRGVLFDTFEGTATVEDVTVERTGEFEDAITVDGNRTAKTPTEVSFGNVSVGSVDRGISIQDVQGPTTVEDTTVSGVSNGDGLDIGTAGNITIENVSVTNAEFDGLYADSSDGQVTIRDVDIDGGERGIYVSNADQSVMASNLIVEGTDFEGVYFYSGDGGVNASDVLVENAGGQGLTVGDAETEVRLRNVTTVGVGDTGVALDSNGAIDARTVDVDAADGVGVELDGRNVTVTNVDVNDTEGDGTVLRSGKSATVKRMTVTNTTADDLDVDDIPVSLTNFSLSSARLDGDARDVEIDAVSESVRPKLSSDKTDVGAYFEATNTTSDGYLNATVHYDDDDATSADESTLELYRHDGSWSQVGGTVDTDANTVSANLTSFSVFAPLGNTTTAGASFDVTIDSTNSPVDETNTLTVDVTVTNTGGTQGTQTLTLSTDGTERDSQSVTLNASNSTQISLSWTTSDGDAGDYIARVESSNTSDSTGVTVDSSTDDDDTSDDETATTTTTEETTTSTTTEENTSDTTTAEPISTTVAETTGSQAPGFGPLATVVAFIGTALLVITRKSE